MLRIRKIRKNCACREKKNVEKYHRKKMKKKEMRSRTSVKAVQFLVKTLLFFGDHLHERACLDE